MNEAREPELEVLYDAATIAERVRELGRRIEASQSDRELLFISIVGGSVVFLADLIRSLSRPVRYETVQVVYSATAQPGDLLEIQYPISLDVSAQPVVIVKDVVSTGVPESYLISQLLQRGAERVQIAALIDLPEERRVDVEPDYRVFAPKRLGTFAGYGLKYHGRYGNLPYLARIVSAGESRASVRAL